MSFYDRFNRGIQRLLSAVEFSAELLTSPELWALAGRVLRGLWEFTWKLSVGIAILLGLCYHFEATIILLLGFIIFL